MRIPRMTYFLRSNNDVMHEYKTLVPDMVKYHVTYVKISGNLALNKKGIYSTETTKLLFIYT